MKQRAWKPHDRYMLLTALILLKHPVSQIGSFSKLINKNNLIWFRLLIQYLYNFQNYVVLIKCRVGGPRSVTVSNIKLINY